MIALGLILPQGAMAGEGPVKTIGSLKALNQMRGLAGLQTLSPLDFQLFKKNPLALQAHAAVNWLGSANTTAFPEISDVQRARFQRTAYDTILTHSPEELGNYLDQVERQLPSASASGQAKGTLVAAAKALATSGLPLAELNKVFDGNADRGLPVPHSKRAKDLSHANDSTVSKWLEEVPDYFVRHDPPLHEILKNDVDFYIPNFAEHKEHPPLRLSQGAYLQIEISQPGVVVAFKKDGSSDHYLIRQTGLANVYETFLPPDIAEFRIHTIKDGEIWNFPLEKITRKKKTRAISSGKPWLKWIDLNLPTQGSPVADRAALYGFLMSLFRIDWDVPIIAANPSLAALPRGVKPDKEAVILILKRLGQRWDALGLENVHGSFDYWLTLAATGHFQSPASLWRAARILKALDRPRTLLYLAKMLSLHLRGTPGHPIERFGDPEFPQAGFVDPAIMVDILPGLIAHFLDKYQDQPEIGQPGTISERTLYLWVIASAIDPFIYLEKLGMERYSRSFSYHRQLLTKLQRLKKPERLRRLYQEILKTDWVNSRQLNPPWFAHSRVQASGQYHGIQAPNDRLLDPRPIKIFAFSPDKDKPVPFIGDPGLFNLKPSRFLRYEDWRDFIVRSEKAYRESLAKNIKTLTETR